MICRDEDTQLDFLLFLPSKDVASSEDSSKRYATGRVYKSMAVAASISALTDVSPYSTLLSRY